MERQSTFASTKASEKSSGIDPHTFNLNCGDLGIEEIHPVKTIREHENSVDALCVNPISEKEFATASHDQTIKIWDAPGYKCRTTLKGHEKGVWSLMYDAQGKRLVSASPDTFVKIWDAKSGKCAETLKGHTSFCYKACFDGSGNHVVSVGADYVVNFWDLRKAKAPLFQNKESQNVLMSCDMMANDQHIITTSIDGQVGVIDTKTQSRIFLYESLPLMIAADKENRLPEQMQESLAETKPHAPKPKKDDEFSNIMYACRAIKGVPGEENTFLIGAQDKSITKFTLQGGSYEATDIFQGHSMGTRSLEVSKDGKKMVSGCEDHSLRIWDYESLKSEKILAGHHDVVTGGSFLNKDTIVSSSWDCRIMIWKI